MVPGLQPRRCRQWPLRGAADQWRPFGLRLVPARHMVVGLDVRDRQRSRRKFALGVDDEKVGLFVVRLLLVGEDDLVVLFLFLLVRRRLKDVAAARRPPLGLLLLKPRHVVPRPLQLRRRRQRWRRRRGIVSSTIYVPGRIASRAAVATTKFGDGKPTVIAWRAKPTKLKLVLLPAGAV